MSQPLRLVDQIRAVARMEHLSLRTEESYLAYIKEFFLFHNKRHARELGVPEIRAYLSHLAVEPKVGHQLRMWRSVPCCFFIVGF
jgi:hypothetical protein